MRAVFWLILLFLSAPLFAQSDLSAEVKRSEALYTESIPHLLISKAPLEEALAVIRRFWEQSHPMEPFPVGITDYEFGVRFQQGMMVGLADAGKLLVVRNTAPQQQQIAGILLLLKNGFEIRKPTASPPEAEPPAPH